MNLLLVLAFLFCMGSFGGWCLEVVFRRFFSAANPERRWINPGFCTGPYLPLYGSGLCILFLIAMLERFEPFESPVVCRIVLFAGMAVCMTGIEYIAGIISVELFRVRLWDYSGEWGNIRGIICPKFSLYWAILGAGYYFLVHPHILDALMWLSQNLAFSFFIGLFFGVFAVDVTHSAQLIVKLKRFAKDNELIVHYENLKAHIRSMQEKASERQHFFRAFRAEHPLNDYLKEMAESFEKRLRRK